ncbi:MAG: HAMP domain-containing histidine kinase [Carboxylicivirga sp.]|nr:HAMP domain-containing histidine kinase [Carboxylicivirga sp.]
MNKPFSVRLHTKISVFFLLVTGLAFLISAKLLIKSIENNINEDVEHVFRHKRQAMIASVKNNTSVKIINADYREVKGYKEGILLIKDTMMLGQDSVQYHLFRLQNEILTINGKQYLLQMRINIDEVKWLKDDLVETLRMVFAILLVVIVFFNVAISSYLLRPFRAIHNQMNQFRVGEFSSLKKIKSTTREVVEIQEPFHRMAQQAEDDYRHLKEYTENMAHEFQTPLAIIRNKTEILIADNTVMDKQAPTVKAIYDETNHMSKLGSKLRLLTKIENHEFKNKVLINTHQTIVNHTEKLQELAGLKKLTIELNLNEEHCILIDPILLDIVIKNLLRNAILYATHGSVINIETHQASLTISNKGEAMRDNGKNLFQRFSKGNTQTSSLGLGLAIVKKICELNQLEISYSYEGQEHIFKIINLEA